MLKKCVEIWPSFTIATLTFERYGIFRRGLIVFESTHSELEFEHKSCIFSVAIKRVIVI